MFIFIALILSVILQLGASLLAVSLIKRTKYNASWILISIGFTIMAGQRIYDLIYILHENLDVAKQSLVSNWLSVLISLLIFIGTFFIKKIFNLQQRIDAIRKENESRVFSAIIRTEERERQTFAKELHDGLGPILSSIKMALSAINQSIAGETNKQIITKTNFAIDEAIITVKEISNKLSPHILTNFGIEKAIKSFIDTIMLDKHMKVNLTSNLQTTRYDFTIETVIYRVICELIANTLHHAQAQSLSITLTSFEKEIQVEYSDDGVGFNIEQIEQKGMGLSNMQSRIKSINGNLTIESSENKGISVKISVQI